MPVTEKATKRRSVSKARLFKEITASVKGHNLNADDSIGTLLDAIKNDIVDEALKN